MQPTLNLRELSHSLSSNLLGKQKIAGSRFNKFYERISSLKSDVPPTLKGKNVSLSSQIAERWALHYLLKGAEYPQWDNKPLSPVGKYRCNPPVYYRAAGNGLTKFHENILTNEGYEFLFGHHRETQAIGILVKDLSFKRKFKDEADYHPIFKDKVNIPGEFNDRLASLKTFLEKNKGKQIAGFVDVGQVIAPFGFDGNLAPADLKNRFHAVNELLQQFPKPHQHSYVGVIELASKEIYAFILSPQASSQEAKQHLSFLKTLRTTGYFPDVARVENLLIENHRLNLGALSQLFPKIRTTKASVYKLPTLEQMHKTALSLVQELSSKSSETAHIFYYNLCLDILKILDPKNLSLNDATALQIAGNAYKELNYILKQETKDFSGFLDQIDLIFEEFGLLSRFDTTLNFDNMIQSLSTIDQVPSITNSYTSAMNAFSHLIAALHKTLKKGQQPLTALLSDSSYFELPKVLTPHAKKRLTTEIKPFTQRIDSAPYDVIFTDIHPNDVTKELAFSINLKETIPLADILKRETPLVIVIDVSTTLFYDEQIKELVRHYEKAIAKGTLTVVLVNSLEKLGQCGLDKFPAGLTAIYGDPQSAFCLKMQKYADKDPLSEDAKAFLKLFLINQGKPVEIYKAHILKSTNRLYELLSARMTGFNQSSFELVEKKSEDIPLLAFHYDQFSKQILSKLPKLSFDKERNLKECIGNLLRDWILIQAKIQGLPMSKRPSFGFSHPNLNTCPENTLRFTVGLHSEKDLENYAKLFEETDLSLGAKSSILEQYAESISRIASHEDYEEKLQAILSSEIPESILDCYQDASTPPSNEGFLAFLDYLVRTLQPESEVKSPSSPRRGTGRGAPRGRGATNPRPRGLSSRGSRGNSVRGSNSTNSGRGSPSNRSDLQSRGLKTRGLQNTRG